MGLFTFGNSLSAQTAEGNKKILVAYFSCTGTTEKVAEAIANESGGKLYKITPVEAYTSADLDWQNKKAAVRWKWQTRNHALHWVAKPSI